MENDETLFETDGVSISQETLNKRVGDLSVRELIKILMLIKNDKDPMVVAYHNTKGEIIKLLKEEPNMSMYDLAKELGVSYSKIKYHIGTLETKGKLIGEEYLDTTNRKKIRYTIVEDL